MKKGAMRYNEGKPKLSLILDSPKPLGGLAKVLENGVEKYGRGNWTNGFEHTTIMDSMLRHLTAYAGGEDLDPESGLPHVDHIFANALFLSDGYHNFPERDDRINVTKVFNQTQESDTSLGGINVPHPKMAK